MLIPPKPPKRKYLKLNELKPDTYYTCGLSGNKVFISSTGFKSQLNNMIMGTIFYKGEYLINAYHDYMLY